MKYVGYRNIKFKKELPGWGEHNEKDESSGHQDVDDEVDNKQEYPAQLLLLLELDQQRQIITEDFRQCFGSRFIKSGSGSSILKVNPDPGF